MAGISQSDRDFCKNLVNSRDGIFSTTYRFAQPLFKDRLLSLRAMTSEIGSIPFRVADQGVARIKIAWWHSELQPDMASVSQHPIVRSLTESGALGTVSKEILDKYFSAITKMTSGQSITGVDQLINIAEQAGGSEAILECAGGGLKSMENSVRAIGLGRFLYSLLSKPTGTFCEQTWWVPLDLQAKYEITLELTRAGRFTDRIGMIVQQFAGIALDAFGGTLTQLKSDPMASHSNPGIHHLKISAAVLQKRLERLIANPVKFDFGKVGTGEIFTAWRQAIRK